MFYNSSSGITILRYVEVLFLFKTLKFLINMWICEYFYSQLRRKSTIVWHSIPNYYFYCLVKVRKVKRKIDRLCMYYNYIYNYDIITKTGVSLKFKWEYFKVPDFGKKKNIFLVQNESEPCKVYTVLSKFRKINE